MYRHAEFYITALLRVPKIVNPVFYRRPAEADRYAKAIRQLQRVGCGGFEPLMILAGDGDTAGVHKTGSSAGMH